VSAPGSGRFLAGTDGPPAYIAASATMAHNRIVFCVFFNIVFVLSKRFVVGLSG
jgi:hypothetical protein